MTLAPSLAPPSGSRFAPMRASNTPNVDARYWVAISAASVFGCNLGDFVSLYLHLGHWIGLLPLGGMLALVLLGERKMEWTGQAWYWAAVIILRTAATNLADLATHTFSLPCPWVIAAVEGLQILIVLRLAPRRINAAVAGRPNTEAWYWAALLTAGVLGTVIGDGVAEDLHLGTGLATSVLGALTIVIVALGGPSRWQSRLSYWLAIVAVRAAGTTAGDWLAFGERGGLWTELHSGLTCGLPLATTASGSLFVCVLIFWRPDGPKGRIDARTSAGLAAKRG